MMSELFNDCAKLRWHWLRRRSDGSLRMGWRGTTGWRVADSIGRTTARDDREVIRNYDWVSAVQVPE